MDVSDTGSLKTGDKFTEVVHTATGDHTTSVTYDGSGHVTFNIDASWGTVDYVTLTGSSSNMNFKITGLSVEYSQPVDPADQTLQFTAGATDSDGSTASDSFTVNLLAGTAGNDTLSTGNSNDTVSGGAGNDIISTGSGNDILVGGQGDDTLTGGLGADNFVWKNGDQAGTSLGDTVKDFSIAQHDVLDLSDMLQGEHANAASLSNYLTFSTSNGNTVIAVHANGDATVSQTITLQGVDLVTGHSQTEIINSLLSGGNLKTDA